MKNINLRITFSFCLIILLSSCTNNNRFKIDTSKNRVEVKIHRFDKDLLSLDTANMKVGLDSIYSRYRDFLPVFTGNILDTAATDTVAVGHLFHQFLTDSSFKPVNKKALETFKDVSDIEKKVSDAYTYIHYYS